MSFYTSLNGLKNAQTDLGVIAHNIANVETGGFKRSRTEFGDIVASSAQSNPRMTVGIGAAVEAVTQDFGAGAVEQTGATLDLAITGDGFFTTRSAKSGETQFTRYGRFELDQNGFVQDGMGNRLQIFAADGAGIIAGGVPGDTQVAPTNAAGARFAGIAIDGEGLVQATYTDGSVTTLGAVALAQFTTPTGLRQVGSSNWQTTGLSGQPAYGQPGEGGYGRLMSGALERSNVDLGEELVGLITAQRNFQANAKAIDTATQLSQTLINLRS